MSLVSLLVLRLVGRLNRFLRHDPLTGLLNRCAMDELLAQEDQRVRRMAGRDDSTTAAQMAVLMIDIDHFKRVNDLQGHSRCARPEPGASPAATGSVCALLAA